VAGFRGSPQQREVLTWIAGAGWALDDGSGGGLSGRSFGMLTEDMAESHTALKLLCIPSSGVFRYSHLKMRAGNMDQHKTYDKTSEIINISFCMLFRVAECNPELIKEEHF
jgi:hypothetical protein